MLIRSPFYFEFQVEKYIQDLNRPGLFVNEAQVFAEDIDKVHLSAGAQRILGCPNAGGSSVKSEALSFELMKRCFQASLLKTEMEIKYFPHGGSITDYCIKAFDLTLGVSVTRAFKYKGQGAFGAEDAKRLLNKKLTGINSSSRNVQDSKFYKQILHVWTNSKVIAKTLSVQFARLDHDVRSNTLVIVTVARDCQWVL